MFINAFPFFLTVGILLALFILPPILWKKGQKIRRVGVTLVLIALFFEVFIANFHSFHLLFGGYKATDISLDAENVSISGATPTETGSFTSPGNGGTVTVTVTGLAQKVGTVHVLCSLPSIDIDAKDRGTPSVTVKVDAKDETQSREWRAVETDGKIVRGDKRTSYIVLDLSGNVSELRIRLNAANGQTFTLEGIQLNRAVPFKLSTLRLLVFVLLVLGIYVLCTHPSWKAAYGEKKNILRTAVLAMTVIMILGALAINFLNMYDSRGGISGGFKNTSGNQITQELVDAFEAGQVSLLDTPGKELLEMENPYDWSARREAGIYYKWDHLLFNGKYYSYYGIAPVILMYMPYHALTGYYCPTAESIWLFGALGILFLSLLFLEIAELYGRKIPNNILFCTLFIMQISSGVWYNFMRDNFYEISQACGFMFTCAGFFFLLRSKILSDGDRILYRHLILSSVCLSLAVLSRPTLALYCIISLIFLYFGLRKHIDQAKAQKDGSVAPSVVKYLTAALLPFAVIGGVQMIYNYARFGSILDFGIQYSLTINDFTRSQYHTDFVMIGIFNFLFAFPIIKPEFPYVASNFSTLSTNGYYYVANRNAVGILFRALPTFGYLGAFRAFKEMDKKDRIKALCLIVPTCIIAPLIIIFTIWESGYGVRYCADFAWQMILGGALVVWFLYCKAADRQVKTILERAFVAAAVVALVINGAMLYDYMQKTGYLASVYLALERTFNFWM